MTTPRVAAVAGIVGPVAFIGAWVASNIATAADYSPVDDAISRLAAVGADTRPLMTGGFIVFGVSLPIFATVLRQVVSGPAWIAAAATGIATLGVAATPLDFSDAVDSLHALAATAGYVALAATPLLAAGPLRAAGYGALARAGQVAGATSAVALALSATTDANGLFQRIGLTATDTWIVVTAALIASRRVTA